MKGIEWDQLVELIKHEQSRLLGELLMQSDIETTQFVRGSIDALKWVLDLPALKEEEAAFEREAMDG